MKKQIRRGKSGTTKAAKKPCRGKDGTKGTGTARAKVAKVCAPLAAALQKSEAALRRSQENLTRAERIAKLGNWEWNIRTNELVWSDEVYRIYGMDPARDRTSYETLMRTIAPEYRDRFESAVERAVKDGVPFEGEYRMIGLDGKERYIHTIGEVQHDRSGRAVAMFGAVQDITRRRKVEESLRKGEALYQELVETAQDLVWQCDAEGRFSYLNGAWEEVLGYPVEEMLGRQFTEFQEAGTARKDRGLFEDLLRGGAVKYYETVYRSKDGRDVCLVFNARNVRDEKGEVIGTRGTAHDVTARKRMEERLQESEEKYRLLVEAANSVILTWDTSGNILFVNDYGERFFGFGKGDLIGRNVVGSIVPETESTGRDLALLMREIEKNPERFKDNENENVTRDGRRVWVRWANKAVTDKHGRLTGILSVGSDITERRRAEAEIAERGALVQQIMDTANVGIACVDLAGRFTQANTRMADLFGCTVAELIGSDYLDRVHPSEREEGRKRMRGLATGEVPFVDLDRMYLRRDGTPFWGHLTCNRFLDAAGHTVGLIGVIADITERKLVEDALKASEERSRFFLENANDAVLIHSFDDTGMPGPFTDVNGLACAWTGYSREELSRMRPEDLDDPQHQHVVADVAAKLKSDGYAVFETCWIKKDGGRLQVEISSRTLKIRDKVYIVSLARDITARKQAEEALKKREQQLAESQRIAHVGSWEHNPRTGEVFWSDELFRLLGLDPAKDPADFGLFFGMIHPEDQPRLDAAVEETLREKKPFDIEYRFVLRDGRTRIIHARADLVPDKDGALTVLSGTGQDITERKRAEEKVRESEQFIRNILDTVDEGFIVIDRDYRIVTANKAYCSQAGRSCDDVIGRNCFEISHKASRPCYEEGEDCSVRHVFATGEPHAVLHRHVDGDGHVLYVETKAFPVRDGTGRVTSAIETINNITEKHLLEEERLKTQKLESIGALAGGIAHDFNNLLQGVFGFISMAKLSADDRTKSIGALEEAEKALHLTVKLTNQLLTFSKGGTPVKRPTDLRPVIENAVTFALSGSRIDCSIDADRDLWYAEADDGQIAQVVQNIVLNAGQAMPTGGTVEITARNAVAPGDGVPRQLAPGRYVEITVRDTGAGIPEQYLSRIFDPYFTTKARGSGLGLATSYSIIRNHGGAIDVRSEIGAGTTFLLYLPASSAAPAQQASAVAPAAEKHGRILLMDDDELVRTITGRLIEALGHNVEFSQNGEEALGKYQAAAERGQPFDVVILDLTVRGGMGGAETLQKLLKTAPSVKAVVSSGYSDDSVISEHRKHGFRAFLKKPYDIAALQDTLNSLLS